MKTSVLFAGLLLIGAVAGGATKLDTLTEAMRTIKSTSSQELVELEAKQRSDVQTTSNLLADLASQVAEITQSREKLQQSLDELHNEIIPELQLKRNVTEEQLQLLREQSTVAKAELLTVSKDSAHNIDALSQDFDSISQLAQKVADVLQNSDVLASATRQFVTVAARQLYTGPSLDETCTSREVISTVLNGLLQHLQEARDNEISHVSQVKESYEKYLLSLDQQMTTVANASMMYLSRQQEAEIRSSAVSAHITQLNTKLATLTNRITKLESFKQVTLSAFSMRADVLNRSIEKANRIIQLIVLLQAKMSIRTVSTE